MSMFHLNGLHGCISFTKSTPSSSLNRSVASFMVEYEHSVVPIHQLAVLVYVKHLRIVDAFAISVDLQYEGRNSELLHAKRLSDGSNFEIAVLSEHMLQIIIGSIPARSNHSTTIMQPFTLLFEHSVIPPAEALAQIVVSAVVENDPHLVREMRPPYRIRHLANPTPQITATRAKYAKTVETLEKAGERVDGMKAAELEAIVKLPRSDWAGQLQFEEDANQLFIANATLPLSLIEAQRFSTSQTGPAIEVEIPTPAPTPIRDSFTPLLPLGSSEHEEHGIRPLSLQTDLSHPFDISLPLPNNSTSSLSTFETAWTRPPSTLLRDPGHIGHFYSSTIRLARGGTIYSGLPSSNILDPMFLPRMPRRPTLMTRSSGGSASRQALNDVIVTWIGTRRVRSMEEFGMAIDRIEFEGTMGRKRSFETI